MQSVTVTPATAAPRPYFAIETPTIGAACSGGVLMSHGPAAIINEPAKNAARARITLFFRIFIAQVLSVL
jgi:hypothetical protein